MSIRPFVLAAIACFPLATALYAPSAEARGHLDVSVNIAPPAPRYERVVVRPGYVWSPGYWRWTGHRHVWVGGYQMPARHGYRYYGPRWVAAGPRWQWHRGYWGR